MQDSSNLNDEILAAIEEFLGYTFPKPYREFLLKKNGVRRVEKLFFFRDHPQEGSCLDSLFGVYKDFNNNLLVRLKYLGDRIPSNMTPIGRDVYGNLILLAVKGLDRGKIYFWDHELEADPAQGERPDYSNLTLIADSFSDFMDGLSDIEAVEDDDRGA